MDRSYAMETRGAGQSGCCNGRPSWALVRSTSLIGDRTNATTAETSTSRGFTIKVSFELADPPGVSLCFVHCTTSGRNESHIVGEPHILTAAQAFVLLSISFAGGGGARHHSAFHDYFVYQAGPGRPRLHRIPIPAYPRVFDHQKIAILPLADGHYAAVIPDSSYNHRARSMRFSLRVFWSETKRWTTKEALLARDSETDYFMAIGHQAAGVISVGGGVLGWVDLWWGILLCNVLDENPSMRLLQWPVPQPDMDFLDYSCSLELNHISPRPFRDAAAVVDGSIKFVELKLHEHDAGQGWTIAVWSRAVSSSLDRWHQSSTVHTDDISVADDPVLMNQIPLLLPAIFDEESRRLTWDRVTCYSPTMSLTDDDVVHIMVSAKSGYQAYLLLVNVRTKTLQGLEKYDANRSIPPETTYIASAFPAYLDMTTSALCLN